MVKSSEMADNVITPALPIAEAGRLIMANELATVQSHWPALRLSADVTAVHETRKALRRTFTLFKIFAPYFAPGTLARQHDELRRVMRRLAPCRDVAVFRVKLAAYNEAAERPLHNLADYWGYRQMRADESLRDFLNRKSTMRLMDRFAHLAMTTGAGLPEHHDKTAPLLVRHVLPGLIFHRLGDVRAWGEILPTATPKQFHQLRIQFKELRYTLSFFEEIISAGGILEISKRIQETLGDLNDASVAIDLLKEMEHLREETAIYAGYQRAELERLMGEFRPLYAEFDRPKLRRELAVAMANL